jgi:hypothetical protein
LAVAALQQYRYRRQRRKSLRGFDDPDDGIG